MEGASKNSKRSFIGGWVRAISSAFLRGAIKKQYRYETPERQGRRGGGAWRNMNPDAGASWGKKGIRRHKAWREAQRLAAHHQAATAQRLHDEGKTPARALSDRAFVRRGVRILAKHRVS